MKIRASYFQERICFVDKFERNVLYKEGSSYQNVSITLRSRQAFDMDSVQKALQIIFSKHEILRTKLMWEEATLFQVISSAEDLNIRDYVELNNSPILCEDLHSECQKRLLNAFSEGITDKLVKISYLINSEGIYLLFFVLHHSICDLDAKYLFYAEFVNYYNSFTNGTPIHETAVALQYADYSEWQRNMDEALREEQFLYWKRKLGDYLEPLILPIDQKRAEIHVYRGAQIKWHVDKDTLNQINMFCRNHFVEKDMFFLAIFKIVLAKLSHQDEINIGTNIPNEYIEGIENTMGPTSNLVVLHDKFDADDTFLSVLSKVEETYKHAKEHAIIPFEDLVMKLHYANDMSRTALFDVLYNYRYLRKKLMISETEFVPENYGFGKYDYNLLIQDYGDDLYIILTYNELYYYERTVNLMISAFQELIAQVLENIQISTQKMKIISPNDERHIIEKIAVRANHEYSNQTIHAFFHERALQYAEKEAVKDGKKSITYRELDAFSTKIAIALRSLGLKEKMICPLIMDKSIECVIVILAILKAGGTYLPIAPELPYDRVQYILDDCGAEIVVINKKYAALAEPKRCINYEQLLAIHNKDNDCTSSVNAESAAYIIYTSGTTGMPKGVVVTHRSLTTLIDNTQTLYLFTEKDKWTMFHSYNFDFSVWEMFGALLTGGEVVIVSADLARDTRNFAKLIMDEGITVLNQTPAAFYSLISDLGVFTNRMRLRYIIFGGECLNEAKIKSMHEAFPDVKMVNMYGITETTIHATYKEINFEDNEKIGCIGLALPSYRIYIMDENRNILPIGVPGEIVVGGSGVAEGYLNQPELTKQKFFNNPFVPGERLYSSGDLARYDWDGEIQYLGRIDEQVKIRGFRIELGEIEAVINDADEIKDCTVICRKDFMNEDALFAYVVSDKRIDLEKLKLTLKKSLPYYEIPAYIMQIDEIPLTNNGKKDTKALPAILKTGTHQYIPPKNETQQKLCEVFEEVLGVSQIGILDNFFELGGHSLRAVKAINIIAEKMHKRIDISEFFIHPTIEELEKIYSEIITPEYRISEDYERKPYYPITPMQEQIYISTKFAPESTQYNMPIAIRFRKALDIDRLKKAIQELTEIYDVLRTSYHVIDNRVVFMLHADVDPKIETLVLDDYNSNLNEHFASFIRPFSLEQAPLLRIRIITFRNSEEMILMTDIHHIICDGISVGVLFNSLLSIYNGEKIQPSFPYVAYSQWFQEFDFSTQEKYWLKDLSGAIYPTEIATDYPRPSVMTRQAGTERVILPREVRENITKICKIENVTEYMFLLASLSVLLSKKSNKKEIIIGTPVSGRINDRIKNTVGLFVNTLPIRVVLERDNSFSDVLQKVKEKCLGALDNQLYPFEQIVKKLNIAREATHNPLFDIMFSMNNWDKPQIALETNDYSILPSDFSVVKFDLFFSAYENSNNEMELIIQYSKEIYRDTMMRVMAEQWVEYTRIFADNPRVSIDNTTLNHFPSQAWQCAKQTEIKLEETIIDLFEQSAMLHYEKTAIVDEHRELTYGDFYKHVNILANSLRRTGLVPGDCIAIVMQRKLELVEIIFAILKIGCVYVPIEQSYPHSRKQFIIEDSGAKLIIADSEEKEYIDALCGKNRVIAWKTLFAEPDSSKIRSLASPTEPAYILYTSGSTGNPKGVKIPHKAVSNIIQNLDLLQPAEKVVYLLKTNYMFDVSIAELFGWFLSGGKIVVLDQALDKLPSEIANAIRMYHITHVSFVPSMLSMFLKHIESTREVFPDLRYLNIAGEAFPPQTAKLCRELLPQVIIENMYGPTESTVYATHWRADQFDFANMPIGRPFNNIRSYIVNSSQTPCSIGEIGELVLAGESLALEYVNLPTLTAERFTDLPSANEARVYHTGDLCRYLWNGEIEYLGRNDSQVKIRGYRVELGEIESYLRQFPGISNAIVLMSESNLGLKTLYAYYEGLLREESEIKAFLYEKIPAYMVPAFIIHVETLPRLVSGKVDKNKLLSIKEKREITEAVTNCQKRMVELWKKALDVSEIGITEAFFDVGGDSLKAIILVDMINQEFGTHYMVQDLFQYVNIEMLCEKIQDDIIGETTSDNNAQIEEIEF